MNYDYRSRKIVAILSEELLPGRALNALGHLAFSAGHYAADDMMGQKELTDADGTKHIGIAKYPFIVLKAKTAEVKRVTKDARASGLLVIDCPQQLFDTGPDDEYVAALSKAKDPLIHAAVIVGDAETIKTLTGHLKLYK